MKRFMLIAALMYSLLVCGAVANSTPVTFSGMNGGLVTPVKNGDIAMIRETVNIECAWSTYSVHVEFWFKNLTDQEQQVDMGFPLDYGSRVEDQYGDMGMLSQVFHVTWDGEKIEHQLCPAHPGTLAKGSHDSAEMMRQWVQWSVRLAAGQQICHTVDYTLPLAGYDPGGAGDAGEPYFFLKYVLKTGAGWARPIETSVVTIHYAHPVNADFVEFGDAEIPQATKLKIYPAGYELDEANSRISWTFKDFVPQHDIYFGLGPVPDFARLDASSPIEHNEPKEN